MPEYQQMFQITGVPTVNQGIGGVIVKTWDQRTRSAHEIQQDLQPKWNKIAGGRVAAFQFPPLPGASGLPVQFVITTTEPFENLNAVAQQVLRQGARRGKFYFLDVDLKIDKPQATVVVDRDKIAALGMTQQDVGARARRGAGRRLRQLLLDRRPLVQGDPAGAAGGPAEPGERARLLHQDAERPA